MLTAQRPQSQFITLSKYYSLKHDQCSASASHKIDIYMCCHVPALVEPLLHDCTFLQTIILKHYASDKFQGLDPRTPLDSFCLFWFPYFMLLLRIKMASYCALSFPYLSY